MPRLVDMDLDYGLIAICGTKFYNLMLLLVGRDVAQILRKLMAMPEKWSQHYLPFSS